VGAGRGDILGESGAAQPKPKVRKTLDTTGHDEDSFGTLATLLLVAITAAYADPEAEYLECIRNKNSKACQNALKRLEKEKKPEDILRNT
jgi:hypothetical protein